MPAPKQEWLLGLVRDYLVSIKCFSTVTALESELEIVRVGNLPLGSSKLEEMARATILSGKMSADKLPAEKISTPTLTPSPSQKSLLQKPMPKSNNNNNQANRPRKSPRPEEDALTEPEGRDIITPISSVNLNLQTPQGELLPKPPSYNYEKGYSRYSIPPEDLHCIDWEDSRIHYIYAPNAQKPTVPESKLGAPSYEPPLFAYSYNKNTYDLMQQYNEEQEEQANASAASQTPTTPPGEQHPIVEGDNTSTDPKGDILAAMRHDPKANAMQMLRISENIKNSCKNLKEMASEGTDEQDVQQILQPLLLSGGNLVANKRLVKRVEEKLRGADNEVLNTLRIASDKGVDSLITALDSLKLLMPISSPLAREKTSSSADSDDDIPSITPASKPVAISKSDRMSRTPSYKRLEFAVKPSSQYECFPLKIVYVKGKTGFEETREYPLEKDAIVAGRYAIKELLGDAAFSRAVSCLDHHTSKMVCLKVIRNDKEFFDQSLDEIKLLSLLNKHKHWAEKYNVLTMYDYFYFKEHMFIVTELLRDNLYEFYKYNRQCGGELYFTISRLKVITAHILVALQFIHSLNLIHCDLKPENILIKSYHKCEVKVIDFGSSCFTHDRLCTYVQSRSYRAPEVILGLPYDQRIDIWSLGCIIAELYTGNVLFQNESIPCMLARMIAFMGNFPQHMMDKGLYTRKYFTTTNVIYERRGAQDDDESDIDDYDDDETGYFYLYPHKLTLPQVLQCRDKVFIDFISTLLTVDPEKRPTAEEALQHPWLADVLQR